MFFHISVNTDPGACTPKISFTCDVKIIKATAEVNPDDTGPEMKSIRKPEKGNSFSSLKVLVINNIEHLFQAIDEMLILLEKMFSKQIVPMMVSWYNWWLEQSVVLCILCLYSTLSTIWFKYELANALILYRAGQQNSKVGF